MVVVVVMVVVRGVVRRGHHLEVLHLVQCFFLELLQSFLLHLQLFDLHVVLAHFAGVVGKHLGLKLVGSRHSVYYLVASIMELLHLLVQVVFLTDLSPELVPHVISSVTH